MGMTTPPPVETNETTNSDKTLEELAKQQLEAMKDEPNFEGSDTQKLLVQLSDLEGKTVSVNSETGQYQVTTPGAEGEEPTVLATNIPEGTNPEGFVEVVSNGVENEQKAQELLTRLLQADADNNDPGNNQTAGAGVNNMQDMLQNMGPLGMIFGIIMAVMSGQDIGQALQQFTNPQGSSNDAAATNNQPGNTAPENNEQSTTQEQPQQTAENGQDNEQSGVEQPEQTVESAPETEQTVEPPEQEVSSNDLGGVNGTAVTFQPNQEIALGDPQVDLDNGTMTLGGMSGSDAFNSLSSGDLQQFAMVDATVDQSLGMQNASFQPEAPVSNFGYLTMNA